MKLAISTINYNSKDLLTKLLKQIEVQKIPSTEIWVVDNQSPDDFRDTVKKNFPTINFIQNKENSGFAKGHNLVLSQLNTEYALIINPDTEIPDKSIERMIEFMDQYSNCAIASSLIVDYQGNTNSNGGNFPFGISLLSWLFNLEMIPFFGSSLPNFHRNDKEFQKGGEVDWVGGTFMMVRVNLIKELGFFNEQYFMYFEDADLCYRVKRAGYKIMINPAVTIKHKGGASSENPRFAQFKGELSGLKIFYDNYGNFFERLLIKPTIYLSIFLRIISFWITRKYTISKTYLKVFKYV